MTFLNLSRYSSYILQVRWTNSFPSGRDEARRYCLGWATTLSHGKHGSAIL